MKFKLFVLMALLLGGCNERLYREGLASSSWPSTLSPQYSVFIGTDSQVFLINHSANQKEPLPFFTRKFSHPISDSIRFSKDGKFLLIPIVKDNISAEKSDYYLAIWDIEKHIIFKEISIHRELIGK